MAENMQPSQNTQGGNTVTLQVPKLNMQVVVLALVAVITLFQTYQLWKIGNKTGSGSVKVSTPATSSQGSGSGSNSDAPAAMVGGC